MLSPEILENGGFSKANRKPATFGSKLATHPSYCGWTISVRTTLKPREPIVDKVGVYGVPESSDSRVSLVRDGHFLHQHGSPKVTTDKAAPVSQGSC